MLARLFYGMARNSELPTVLGRINPRTRTPTVATVLAGTIVLAAALLVPFERLLVLNQCAHIRCIRADRLGIMARAELGTGCGNLHATALGSSTRCIVGDGPDAGGILGLAEFSKKPSNSNNTWGQNAVEPHESRCDVGDLEWHEWHCANPGSEWNSRPQRPEEAAKEYARGTPLPEEVLTPWQQLGMPRQRPKSGYLELVVITEPIRKPVTEHRTHGGGEPDRPEADAARADHSANTEQDGSGRQQERDEREQYPRRRERRRPGQPSFRVP